MKGILKLTKRIDNSNASRCEVSYKLSDLFVPMTLSDIFMQESSCIHGRCFEVLYIIVFSFEQFCNRTCRSRGIVLNINSHLEFS